MSELMSDPAAIERLRTALEKAQYTVDGCLEAMGATAYAALARNESVAASRAVAGDDSPVATLTKLFVLQENVDQGSAEAAVPLAEAISGGLLAEDGTDGTVRALVDIRPYGESDVDWWLVSDLGSGLVTGRNAPMRPDYVLGVGGASTTLAQLTVRQNVARALDVGTGCGVQALHLARHAQHVTATDLNLRALDFARLTAALSLGTEAERIELRGGSMFEPVADERYDLIVSNPPFVISPESAAGQGRFTYRDAGLPGDELCRRFLERAPAHLAEDGYCHVLANWLHVDGQDWRERLAPWVRGTGCDAWVVQRELQDPAEYAELWLRDSGDHNSPRYVERYQAYLDYFAANRIEGVAFGWIILRNTGTDQPSIRLEELTRQIEQPLGAYVPDWFARHAFLADTDDEQLLGTILQVAPGVVLEQTAETGDGGWSPTDTRLRQTGGLRATGEIDPVGIAVVGAADGERPVGELLDRIAGQFGIEPAALRSGALDAVRALVEEGFLSTV
ncbi:class I SAM-dependent methyltransferase [Actinospica sp.]|jgi:methylase of polypeptide subunit release factors|uniref:class I SAM-dependent methyltransferase n=1 Tax=Actinospica sp. TaxID=1872142 RepID=UPI002BD5EDCD|nr:class I SAM-dependent methyltransferase [Actinospica sp.]HWG23749.1 class I SAM-dependent methyltransferase [Actinospica sp.]